MLKSTRKTVFNPAACAGFAVCAAVAIGLAGCGGDNTTVPLAQGGTFFGTPVVSGQGQVRSFVTLSANNTPQSLGFQFNEAMLSGLPNANSHTEVPLPPQAANSGYDHLGFDWDPQGHPPVGIYSIAHIDFHNFFITSAAAAAITATGADLINVTATPDSKYYPPGYIPAPGNAVAGEGQHWIDPNAPEFAGAPHGFDKTFIYGFYNGKMDFVEPMLSKATLLSHTNISAPVKMPTTVQHTAYYPSSYSLKYDPNAAGGFVYTVSIDGLTFKQAS